MKERSVKRHIGHAIVIEETEGRTEEAMLKKVDGKRWGETHGNGIKE